MKRFFLSMVAAALAISFFSCGRVALDKPSSGVARFVYGDKNIETEISSSDLEAITEIFDGKTLDSSVPSCGFDEDIAVIIDGQHFCIANDNCGSVWLKDEDSYFHLNDEENETLREILTGYGFSWPCV